MIFQFGTRKKLEAVLRQIIANLSTNGTNQKLLAELVAVKRWNFLIDKRWAAPVNFAEDLLLHYDQVCAPLRIVVAKCEHNFGTFLFQIVYVPKDGVLIAFQDRNWWKNGYITKVKVIDEYVATKDSVQLVDYVDVTVAVKQVFPRLEVRPEVSHEFLRTLSSSYHSLFNIQECSWLASHSGASKDESTVLYSYDDLTIIPYPEMTYLHLGELPDAYYLVARLDCFNDFGIIDHEGTVFFPLANSFTQAVLNLNQLDLQNLDKLVTEPT